MKTAAGWCALGVAVALLGWAVWAFTRPDTRPATVVRPRFEHVISLGYIAHGAAPAMTEDGTLSAVTAESVERSGAQPPLYSPLLTTIDLGFKYEMRSAQPLSVTGYGGTALRITAQDGWERTIALLPAQPLAGPQVTLWSTLDLDVVRLVIEGVEFATGSQSQWYDLTLIAVVRLFGELGSAHIDETYAPEFHWRYDAARITPDASLSRSEMRSESVAVDVAREVDLPGWTLRLSTARWLALGAALTALVGGLLLLWRRREREHSLLPA